MELKHSSKKSSEEKNSDKIFAFLRVIADQNRFKLFCLLQKGSKCVCEIAPLLGISDKLASHHLRQLKSIGLLIEKREGNFIRYGLDKKNIREYKTLLNAVIK